MLGSGQDGGRHNATKANIHKLREAKVLIAQGQTVREAAKQIGVSEQTHFRWRSAYGGMVPNQARRLKELERENARLKKLVADLSLDGVPPYRHAAEVDP